MKPPRRIPAQRDRLEDFLEAAGFLVLRNSGRLFVRPDPDADAKARREALAAAGFPTADLDVRMHEREAIPIEPLSSANGSVRTAAGV